MSAIPAKIKEEFKALLPPTIFFLIALHLVAIIRRLMLERTGIPLSTSASVTVAALVLGKSVLMADMLPVINRYPHKPLIYNVIWKTMIYTLVAVLFHYVEHLIDFRRHTSSFVAANHELIAKIVWPHFWAIQILLVVMIFSYCTMRELVRVIGKRRVFDIFFAKPQTAAAAVAAAAWPLLVLCLCLALIGSGCAKGNSPFGRSEKVPIENIQPQVIAATLTSFSDQYLTAMAETYDRAQHAATTSQARIVAQRLKLLAASGAIGNAVDQNPIVGLMDMAMMVTLTRQIAQEPWAAEMFGKDAAAEIVAVLEVQEANIWKVAASYLSQAQLDELHQLAARWRQRHPEQRYVAGARLANFPEAKGGGANGALAIAGSVFGLVTLDPFHGLDPAVKEVAESRILAERLFFYLRHLPVLASWQTDQLFNQMLADPQMVQLFADTTTVAGSTTRFTAATSQFSQASSRLAETVERFRAQLPDQQAKLVADLNDVIARQREGALQQATTQVSVQRDAAIQQLTASVGAQQDLMTQNLKSVTDSSIDRLYQRSRSLVLITVGSILLAFFIYRRFIAPRSDKRTMETIDGGAPSDDVDAIAAQWEGGDLSMNLGLWATSANGTAGMRNIEADFDVGEDGGFTWDVTMYGPWIGLTVDLF